MGRSSTSTREGVAATGLDDALHAELARELAEPGAGGDDDLVVLLGGTGGRLDDDPTTGVAQGSDGPAGEDLAAAGDDRVGEGVDVGAGVHEALAVQDDRRTDGVGQGRLDASGLVAGEDVEGDVTARRADVLDLLEQCGALFRGAVGGGERLRLVGLGVDAARSEQVEALRATGR